MSGPEKEIENGILEYLRIMGHYCQKTHSGSLFVKKGPMTYRVKLCDEGTPDILAIIKTSSGKGIPVGIEVKKDQAEIDEWHRHWEQHLATKTMKKSWERSIMQNRQHDLIRAAGGEVIVCCSVDEVAADIKTLLDEAGGSLLHGVKKPVRVD